MTCHRTKSKHCLRIEMMAQNQTKPLFLNPAWLASIGATPMTGVYRVFAVPYSHLGLDVREWRHRTLRAAGRRMGSAISGKLRRKGDHAVFAIAPDGTIHNWNTANGKAY